MTWAQHLYSLFRDLEPPQQLPEGIDWLYPQKNPVVMEVFGQFLHRFYSDSNPRTILLGINPGRFGAGVTGINFTAPRQLTQVLGIDHPFGNGTELSAEFIYELIHAYGGSQAFFGRFFIGSVCPLGFVRNGKNINYYDDKELQEQVAPFIEHNLRKLLQFPINTQKGICIGGEKNFRYLSRLNEKHRWFQNLIPLPHPRFIMQYRRSQKSQFIQQYLQSMTD